MKRMLIKLKPALLFFVIMTVICGILYPGVVTAAAQAFFSRQANGSVITVTLKDGTKRSYGSELISQKFTEPRYLIGRPMGSSNLSPLGAKQEKLVQQRIQWWRELDPSNKADIPMDLVTASGSGVDPCISPEAAEYQAARIARTRGMSEELVRDIIKKYTAKRLLGFWGESAVNVLKVNLALDGLL
jgi:K+-transporting ATPase ATPase C chain